MSGKKISYFFTNRLELGYAKTKGNASVYNKLECLRNILNATSNKECDEAFETSYKTGFIDGIQEINQENAGANHGAPAKESKKGSGSGAKISESIK